MELRAKGGPRSPVTIGDESFGQDKHKRVVRVGACRSRIVLCTCV